MDATTPIVRPLQTDTEIDAYCLLAAEAFFSDTDKVGAAERWRRYVEAQPDFHPEQRRGAFLGDMLLGGFMLYERRMRVAGGGELLAGCIGSVVTHPEQRLRGTATLLLRDAATYAEEHGHALLLLDGIPNFYQRFGFADVYDLTEHAIARTAITSGIGNGCRIRTASMADAPALLALYERHFGPYTGSFSRSLSQQEARLRRNLATRNPPVVAVDADGAVCGYLLLPWSGEPAHAGEVAADTWPAVAALLRYHAALLDALPHPPHELWWPLPPDAPALFLLADHLAVPDTSDWIHPSRGWAVRSETYQHRDAAWMARIVSLRRIVEGLLPAWEQRLKAALPEQTPARRFTLRAGDEICAIEAGPRGARLLTEAVPDAPLVAFPPERLVQLVFGYRPVHYVATQPGATVPTELLPLLQTLFPAGHPWIPWTDGF
jgi:GNAT superfamily N-acetyltransferase